MGKSFALIVGVSDYVESFQPLPWAKRDADAIETVLRHPQIGGFDSIVKLLNPQRQELAEAIENLFAERTADDTLLLYFSGHGVKDERGVLHLAVPQTRKRANGELSKATALGAHVIHDSMERSRSRRQIVILDSCFSGAFARNMAAKDSGVVDIASQLGGDGRAVLTASSSTQYAYGADGRNLSAYTHLLTEGILTGAADINNDGLITVDELHEYVKLKLKTASVAMTPMIFTVREGYRIVVCRSAKSDPAGRYQHEVQTLASAGNGTISAVGRIVLDNLRAQLSIDHAKARVIEHGVLEPYRALAERTKLLREAVRNSGQDDRHALERYRQQLGLDSSVLESLLRDHQMEYARTGLAIDDSGSRRRRALMPWVGGGLGLGAVAMFAWAVQSSSPTTPGEEADSPPHVGTSSPSTTKPPSPEASEPSSTRPKSGMPLLGTGRGVIPTNPNLAAHHWVVRLAADSRLRNAEQNARRVAASTLVGGHSVQILQDGSLYVVVVGNFDSQTAAKQAEPTLRQILGEGALIRYMGTICPSPYKDGAVLVCSS